MGLIYESNGVTLLQEENCIFLEGRMTKVVYRLDTGRFSVESNGLAVLKGAFAGVLLEDGGKLFSTWGDGKLSGYTAIQDPLGTGVTLAVTIEGEGIHLRQIFTVYTDRPFILTKLELESRDGVSTNYMAPVIASNEGTGSVIDLGTYTDVRALNVPYDNDYWVRYISCPIKEAKPGYVYPDDLRPRNEDMYREGIKQSYEISAIFDSATRKGLILGSVLHDTWKTGIKISGTADGGVGDVEVYGGCADRFTRDYLPHGFVQGDKVESPTVLIGYYEDYRSGLEEFGKACKALKPPMQWDGGPIFGWNAYAAYEEKMDASRFAHTSRFLKQHLQARGFSNEGKLYINFDYLWNNLTEKQLCNVADLARKNNQHAGIYYTPFSAFTDDLDSPVEGTGGRYTYRDILLRDYEGKVMPKVNSGSQGYAVDPTHPGNLMRVEYMMGRFIEWGFDFVKLDFIAHGAIEGSHYDKSIQTGKQAYDYGMKHLCGLAAPERIGRPFFISLSIAPAFPYHGHSRRISCDAFGHISDSEYMMNSLSYGWWMDGTIYCFNDSDHIVLHRRLNEPGTTEQEARTRINTGIACGGVFLVSDAFMNKKAAGRAIKLLSNEKVTAVIKKGGSFRPVEGNSGKGALDLFYREDDTEVYLAVFNFDGKKKAVKEISLARVGLEDGRTYEFEDLWKGTSVAARETLAVNLDPCESVLLRVKK